MVDMHQREREREREREQVVWCFMKTVDQDIFTLPLRMCDAPICIIMYLAEMGPLFLSGMKEGLGVGQSIA